MDPFSTRATAARPTKNDTQKETQLTFSAFVLGVSIFALVCSIFAAAYTSLCNYLIEWDADYISAYRELSRSGSMNALTEKEQSILRRGRAPTIRELLFRRLWGSKKS